MRSRISEYNWRAAPTHRALAGGSMAMPRSADRYSSWQRSNSNSIRAIQESSTTRRYGSAPNRRRSSAGM